MEIREEITFTYNDTGFVHRENRINFHSYLRVLKEQYFPKGCPLSGLSRFGRYLVHRAVDKFQFGLIEYFMNDGFIIENDAKGRGHILWSAAHTGYIPIIHQLLTEDQRLADLKSNNLLEVASQNGHLDLVKYLVNLGDEVTEMTIQKSAENGRLKIIKYFIEIGIDIASDKFNQTCHVFHSACKSGCLKTVEFLKDFVDDIDRKGGFDNYTALHFAIQNNHIEIVRYLIQNGCDVNSKTTDVFRYTPLQIAVDTQNIEMVRLLLELDVDMYAFMEEYSHSVIYAAMWTKIEILRLLCERGYDVNKNASNYTVLEAAICTQDISFVKCLVEFGVDLHFRYGEGKTCLFSAVSNDNIEIVKYLVEQGCDVNAISDVGEPVLHSAIYCYQLENVKYLVDNGCDLNVRNGDNMTGLHIAARSHSEAVFKYLIEEGADINAIDYNNCSVLVTAAKNGFVYAVKYLLEKNVTFKFKNERNGLTLLHSIALRGHLDVLRMFVKKTELDVNSRDYMNYTVLHGAAEEGNSDVVKFLIRNGADINAKDRYGWNALHFAAYNGHLKIVEYLCEKRIEVDAKCNDSWTVYDLTSIKYNIPIMNYLLDRVCDRKIKRGRG